MSVCLYRGDGSAMGKLHFFFFEIGLSLEIGRNSGLYCVTGCFFFFWACITPNGGGLLFHVFFKNRHAKPTCNFILVILCFGRLNTNETLKLLKSSFQRGKTQWCPTDHQIGGLEESFTGCVTFRPDLSKLRSRDDKVTDTAACSTRSLDSISYF